MLIYIFAIMDLIAAILLILFSFNINLGNVSWIFAVYLMTKGVIFIKSITSFFDIISGILIILAIFGIVNILTWIAAFWLLQKAFFSFL